MKADTSKTSPTSGARRADTDQAIGRCEAILSNIAFMAGKVAEQLARHQDGADGQPLTQAEWYSLRLHVALIGATADRAAQATGGLPVVGGFSEWLAELTCCERDIEQLAANVLQEAKP